MMPPAIAADRLTSSVAVRMLLLVPLTIGCVAASQARGGSVSQVFMSNKPCKVSVDGQQKAAGRRVTIKISDRPHTVTCESPGYKPKVEYVNPPYGENPIQFFFMVGDKLDAPESWQTVHKRERRAAAAAVREKHSGRYPSYREFCTSAAQRFSEALPKEAVVAVVGIANANPSKQGPFVRQLQAELVAAFVDAGIRTVKRDRLDLLFKEMKLQRRMIMDQRSAVRLGAMSGASVIATGTYADRPGVGAVELKVEIVDVSRAIIIRNHRGTVPRTAALLKSL